MKNIDSKTIDGISEVIHRLLKRHRVIPYLKHDLIYYQKNFSFLTSFLLNVFAPGEVDISKAAGTRAGISLVGSPPPPPAGPAITSTVQGDPAIKNLL